MSVNLSRKEPKLNTMYPITINDSMESINCRINFNIIDFIYLSLVKQYDVNKTTYYERLYSFLNIGETYYEKLRNGNKIDKISYRNRSSYVEVNGFIEGEDKLEITGVSTKQWKHYFWICKKYTALRKAGVDKKYINKARERKEQFQKLIFRKIDNMEMSDETCSLYNKLSVYVFGDELSKLYWSKGEKWSEFLKEIDKSDIEGLLKVDKNKFKEVYRLLYKLLKQMKETMEQ